MKTVECAIPRAGLFPAISIALLLGYWTPLKAQYTTELAELHRVCSGNMQSAVSERDKYGYQPNDQLRLENWFIQAISGNTSAEELRRGVAWYENELRRDPSFFPSTFRYYACALGVAADLAGRSSPAPAPSPQAAPKVAAPAAAAEQDLSDPTIRAPSWNTVDWDEAAMMEAGQALEEVLNSSTFGTAQDSSQDASLPQRVIARDGKVAECVGIETITTTDSKLGGGGRVLVNNCSDPVEIGWCTVGGECERGIGNSWTVQPGRSWPVSAEKEIRWGACHGANTFHGDPDSNGTRFTCSAPAGTPPSSEVPTGAGRSNEN